MQWFADAFIFFFSNLHIIAIIFTVIAIILLYVVLSIEFKAKYYLAIKKRMLELESKQIKK